MSGIKRADFTPYGMVEKDDGHYVYFTDHEAEVARLRAELADAHAAIESKAGWEWKREADRLRAEVEGLNRVKEIVAKTRRSNSKAYEQACQNEDGRMQAVCNARTSLLNNIDAAMGEGK